MKAYVDTNILVDLILSREDFLPDAQQIFALGYIGEIELTLSALSFVTTVYLAEKYKYPREQVLTQLRQVADFVEMADLRGQNVVDMLQSGWRDYEDATHHRCAIESNVDCIVTRNVKDFVTNEIQVLSPAEFLKQLL
ncbi:MAG: PIN domain-containing protein [Prevotella sp.]|nr:PIN domain-containing protein [Prevotella sp.]